MAASAFSSYLIFIAIFIAILLVIGIPAILAKVRLPADFSTQELSDLELSPAAREFFQQVDASAQAIYFRPFKNFTIPGFAQKNEHRIYLSGDNAHALLATAMTMQNRVTRVLEFATRFQDDTEADTGNAPVSLLFEKPPWQDAKRYPGLYDLAKLQGYHLERVQKKIAQGVGPKPIAEAQVMLEIERSQVRSCQYQVEKGILKKDQAAGVYRATPKIALRGVWAFLNPLADDFNPVRFLIGAGGALVLAAAWAMLVQNTGLEEILRNYLPALSDVRLKFAAYAPGFVLAGLLAGWQFPQKGFLWAFLVSLPALYFMPGDLPYPLYFSLLAAQSGSFANRLRASIKSGRGRSQLLPAIIVLAVLIAAYYAYVK
jgi:hypothetical protein